MGPNEFVPAGVNPVALNPAAVNPFARIVKESDDPMYIDSHENVGVSLVTQPLVGASNFVTWRKSMEVSLGIKGKLGFICGEFPRPSDPYDAVRWDKCNGMIISWLVSSVSKEIAASLIHSKDCIHAWRSLHMKYGGANLPSIFAVQEQIYALKQGDLSVAKYYNSLEHLWAEEDEMCDYDSCDLGIECKAYKSVYAKKELDRAMKFLMGLNDEYKSVRTQILHQDPLPAMEKIYKTVISEEVQRGNNKVDTHEILAAVYTIQPNFSGKKTVIL